MSLANLTILPPWRLQMLQKHRPDDDRDDQGAADRESGAVVSGMCRTHALRGAALRSRLMIDGYISRSGVYDQAIVDRGLSDTGGASGDRARGSV